MLKNDSGTFCPRSWPCHRWGRLAVLLAARGQPADRPGGARGL